MNHPPTQLFLGKRAKGDCGGKGAHKLPKQVLKKRKNPSPQSWCIDPSGEPSPPQAPTHHCTVVAKTAGPRCPTTHKNSHWPGDCTCLQPTGHLALSVCDFKLDDSSTAASHGHLRIHDRIETATIFADHKVAQATRQNDDCHRSRLGLRPAMQ